MYFSFNSQRAQRLQLLWYSKSFSCPQFCTHTKISYTSVFIKSQLYEIFCLSCYPSISSKISMMTDFNQIPHSKPFVNFHDWDRKTIFSVLGYIWILKSIWNIKCNMEFDTLLSTFKQFVFDSFSILSQNFGKKCKIIGGFQKP